MRLSLYAVYFFAALSAAVFGHGHGGEHVHGHGCNHDTDPTIQNFYKEFEEIAEQQQKKRFLEGKAEKRHLVAATEPFRVTIDTTALDNTAAGITVAQKDYLISITKTIQNFLKNFIRVVQVAGNNKCAAAGCLGVTVPSNDQTVGIPNSDLHLYIIYENTPSASFLANAGWCNMYNAGGIIRPNFGRVNFNIGTMGFAASDLNLFQLNVMMTLHEVIHVLGFSNGSMQYWVNRQTMAYIGSAGVTAMTVTKTIRNISTSLLSPTNALAVAKQYYDCPTMQGVQFENQGGAGSLGSHFERTVLNSEVMTASALNDGTNLTIFSAAILRDTGYWDEVNDNLTDPIWWGRKKGCNFLEYDCTTSTAYPEYVPVNTQTCSFWADGYGISSSETFSDNCAYVRAYSNFSCEDADAGADANNAQKDKFYSEFQYNSRCFVSSIGESGYNFSSRTTRCLVYSCAADQSSITITSSYLAGFTFTCGASDAGVSKTATHNSASIGNITCPTNYAQFCDNQNCKNLCSLQGICIRGTCFCNPGFSGDDCSVACSTYSEGGSCVSSCSAGKYAGPDNTCKTSCPNGYYQGSGVCVQCDFSCGKCSAAGASACTACQFLTFLDTNTCVATCPAGKWGNTTTRLCETCPTGCDDCTSDTVCGTCSSGFTKTGTLCTSSTCDAPCTTCGATATTCTSCTSPNFLNKIASTCGISSTCPTATFANSANQKCDSCSTGCTTCTSATACSVCDTGSGYRLSGASCTLCTAPCATCDAGNVTQCLSCEGGQYLHNSGCVASCPATFYNGPNYQCASCSTGCSVCSSGSSCTTCDTGNSYQAYTQGSNTVCILSSACFSPCATCTTAFQPEICGTCETGKVLQGTSCKASCDSKFYADSTKVCKSCDSTCANCSGSATSCTSCSGSLNLSSGSCLSSCPSGQTASNNVCTTKAKNSLFGSQTRLIFSILSAIIVLLL